MRGSSDRAAAVAAVVLGLGMSTGAALAAPVPVLVATDGARECVGPLAEGDTFEYRYIQSMYRAPVTELLQRHGDRIRMLRARSTDIRAVEYFGWGGDPVHDADGYYEDAPFYETPRLEIRISPEYAQRIATGTWSCDLPALFGGAIVTVTPAVRASVADR
ncbi:MAG: hypothetical protein KGN00_10550 [Chloroflexota bacterium]|nr:hypothetical protein [Chloroflexota bacterium]MDE3194118.1 hypothetical protein [Chloroflexota bacterium]